MPTPAGWPRPVAAAPRGADRAAAAATVPPASPAAAAPACPEASRTVAASRGARGLDRPCTGPDDGTAARLTAAATPLTAAATSPAPRCADASQRTGRAEVSTVTPSLTEPV